MKRDEFTRKTKARAFERSLGYCEYCKARLQVGKFHYDHEIPAALGGSNDLENCKVACEACHGVKTTKRDVPQIAKAKRQQARHIGANDAPKMRSSGFPKRPAQNRASKQLNKWYGWKGTEA